MDNFASSSIFSAGTSLVNHDSELERFLNGVEKPLLSPNKMTSSPGHMSTPSYHSSPSSSSDSEMQQQTLAEAEAKRKSAKIIHDQIPPNVQLPQRKGGMHLWQFLYALLLKPDQYSHLIEWTENRDLFEFRLLKPEAIAVWWGYHKNKKNMSYDKLSRSLRYYYSKKILRKMSGERYVYRFCVDPELMYKALGNSENRPQLKPMPKTTLSTCTENQKAPAEIKMKAASKTPPHHPSFVAEEGNYLQRHQCKWVPEHISPTASFLSSSAPSSASLPTSGYSSPISDLSFDLSPSIHIASTQYEQEYSYNSEINLFYPPPAAQDIIPVTTMPQSVPQALYPSTGYTLSDMFPFAQRPVNQSMIGSYPSLPYPDYEPYNKSSYYTPTPQLVRNGESGFPYTSTSVAVDSQISSMLTSEMNPTVTSYSWGELSSHNPVLPYNDSWPIMGANDSIISSEFIW